MRRDGVSQGRLTRVGSIRPFPASKGATLADVWRAATLPGNAPARVRTAQLGDYAAWRALQKRCAPHAAAMSLRQFESRLLAFPEGQLVASYDGQLAGATSSLVVRWHDHGVEHTWKTITGEGYFATHEAAGQTLFGAEMLVDSALRGYSVARALHQARRRLCRRLNLRRIVVAERLGGFAAARQDMTPETYVTRVIWGDLAEPGLRFALSQGFQYCGVLRGYQPEDAAAGGNAALLAWLNPFHLPPSPPAFAESQRRREVA
jgi:GNAT superfamily N-acetyltransferase